jgi:hypothetical protein
MRWTGSMPVAWWLSGMEHGQGIVGLLLGLCDE